MHLQSTSQYIHQVLGVLQVPSSFSILYVYLYLLLIFLMQKLGPFLVIPKYFFLYEYSFFMKFISMPTGHLSDNKLCRLSGSQI